MTTAKEKRMQKAVKYLTEYMETYDKQLNYEKYSDKTFIDDILYGMGVALDKGKYEYSTGFREFKKVLIKHLTANMGEQ